MQVFFEAIFQTGFELLGALVKWIFGQPRSESGTGEMWIGATVVVALAVLAIYLLRKAA